MTSRIESPASGVFTSVQGVFYRAVDAQFLDAAITGSRTPGRYSNAEQPTLYLSSSKEGVEAAMQAHRHERATALKIVAVEVVSSRILDLRDAAACRSVGINPQNAAKPWQEPVAQGQRPSSWEVRDHVISAGGLGLIDPSRKAPGLWHLVVFSWNCGVDSASVRLQG